MADKVFASTLTQSPDQLTSQFLQCKCCSNVYDEENKFPRLLPCLHTYCNECVVKFISSQLLKCCFCSTVHKVMPDKLDKIFPRDYTRRDLTDFVRVKRAPQAIFCTICPQAAATHRCRDCSHFLCGECVTAHKRVLLTNTHFLIELERLSKEENMDAFCRRMKCPSHSDKELELYCSKESCMKPICMMCAVCDCKESDGHKVGSLKTVEKARQEKIGDLMKNLSEVQKDAEKVITRIGDESGDISNLHQSVNSSIDETFDKLQKIIEDQRSNLKQLVKEHVNGKQKVLADQKCDMEAQTKQMRESLFFSKQALEYKNEAAFLQIDMTISTELQRLIDRWYDKFPHEIATFGFKTSDLVTEVQRCVSERASIWTSSVYSPKTTITQNQEAVENKTVTFGVTLLSYHDEVVTKNADLCTMTATVDGPSGKMDCKIDSTPGSGKGLQVSVNPTASGRHKLELKILDKVIGSQTFEVKAGVPNRMSGSPPEIPKRSSVVLGSTEFTFDTTGVPKDVTLSDDGKIFQNKPSANPSDAFSSLSTQKFKGVVGNLGLKRPGKYSYRLKIDIQVRKPLSNYDLVFEIGLARKSVIGPKKMVQTEEHAWAMIGQTHDACKSICCVVASGDKCILHNTLLPNSTDSTGSVIFGFVFDASAGQWKIYRDDSEKEVCIVNGINCEEELFPTVAAYNPKKIDLTATILLGGPRK